jgi:hypothetical protein
MGPLRNSAANEGGEAPNPAVTLPVDLPRGLTFEGGGGAPNREVELPVNPPRSPAAEGGTNLSRKDVRKKRKAEQKMRGDLQKALKRPVVLIANRRSDPAKRMVVKCLGPALVLGALGAGIASVVVTGSFAAPLAVIAASVPAANFPALLSTKMLDQSPVILTRDMIDRLFKMTDPGKRVSTVRAALGKSTNIGPDGSVTLSAEDIPDILETPSMPRLLGSTGVGVLLGFTVISGGLLLLALTLISQDIHGLMIRAASAILVVGALIVGAAVANGNWLKGLDSPGTPTGQT